MINSKQYILTNIHSDKLIKGSIEKNTHTLYKTWEEIIVVILHIYEAGAISLLFCDSKTLILSN